MAGLPWWYAISHNQHKYLNMGDKIKTLTEADGIALGDTVRLESGSIGIVCAILDYGTHIAFLLDIGKWIKFPARREWIELLEKAGNNE